MNKIIALVRKEFRQIFRDPAMLRVIFLMPMIQLFVLSYAITLDVKNVALIIRDSDHSPVSRYLVEKVKESQRFRLAAFEGSQARLKRWFETSSASVSLSIPEKFEDDLLGGRRPELQVLVDGIDSNTSMVALGYLQKILTFSLQRLPGELHFDLATASGPEIRVTPQIRVWFNPNLESRYYMLPGIVAILVTMTTSLLTGMGIVREREIGTLEQLSVTPIRPYELILGKTIPFAILSFFLLLMAVGVVAFWYGIPMAGQLWLLLSFAFIFLFCTLGIGLFVSTVTSSQLQAVFLTFFFNIFAILMSGLFAPIHNMPKVVQALTYLNPVRYFITIIRGIYLKGVGFDYLWPQGAALLAWGLTVISLAVLRFKKQID